jgi:hypothetical protein
MRYVRATTWCGGSSRYFHPKQIIATVLKKKGRGNLFAPRPNAQTHPPLFLAPKRKHRPPYFKTHVILGQSLIEKFE